MFAPDIEGRKKTFRLWHPRQALEKLRWERGIFVALEEEAAGTEMRDVFAAFNAASTAWHLIEWTFHALKKRDGSVCEFLNEGAFRENCKRQFDELALCRDIANGGKHFRLERNFDPHVSTDFLYILKFKSDENGLLVPNPPPSRRPDRRLTVSKSGAQVQVRDLLSRAIEYWDGRLSELGFRQL